ncbi:MAG: hypothetical protein K8J31_19445 [Anaerolineae bacterium]|nr:hypothetical protein [Anaerolineae bacterium]
MAITHASRRTYAVTLFVILVICYGYFMPRWADWGANSRADLVYAFGDQGVLNIDAYHENTGDKACFAGRDYSGDTPCEDGHYFTDKSLGPSLVALPFYIAFKTIAALPPIEHFIVSGNLPGNFSDTLNPEGQGIRADAVYQGMALTFITFFAVSIPSAFLGVVVFLFAARFATKDGYAFILALAYGLGTMAFPYSMALYQHQMAAFGAFVGFYLLWRIVYEKASLNWLWVVGLLFSLAVITEYPIVLILAIIFIWALIKMPNRLALWRMILAGIPLGLIFMAYNYAAFETPLPVGYEYSTNWQTEHQEGFLSLTHPTLERYYGLTFSPIRGIFVTSPFLLLFFPGVYAMWRRQREQRGVLIAIVLITVAFFSYNASSIMWWGGFSIGPRYLIPMLPFMVIPIIFTLNDWLPRVWGQAAAGLLMAASILMTGAMTIAGQSWPSVPFFPFTVEQMNAFFPLTDQALLMLGQGDVARNYGGILLDLPGLSGLIPVIALVAAVIIFLPWLLDRRSRTQHPTSRLEQATESTH